MTYGGFWAELQGHQMGPALEEARLSKETDRSNNHLQGGQASLVSVHLNYKEGLLVTCS